MMQPKTIGDTLSRLQKETKELKALLAEARPMFDEHERYCLSGFCELCELANRIDAAIAERTPS